MIKMFETCIKTCSIIATHEERMKELMVIKLKTEREFEKRDTKKKKEIKINNDIIPIIIIGSTGAGKSTFINEILGLKEEPLKYKKYNKLINKNEEKENFLLNNYSIYDQNQEIDKKSTKFDKNIIDYKNILKSEKKSNTKWQKYYNYNYILKSLIDYYSSPILLDNFFLLKNYKKIDKLKYFRKNQNIEILCKVEDYIKYNDICTIKYIINENKNAIKIFGEQFVKKNKNKCFIIYENRNYELSSLFKIDEKIKNKNILKIKLNIINSIKDLSYLFYNCSDLISFCKNNILDTFNFTDLSHAFYGCSSLKSLPDISKWDTSEVTNMSNLFFKCSSITEIPNISKWNTKNVIDMSGMFYDCSSLIELPDISNWDTSNVRRMKSMFYNCQSLKNIPHISNWNTNSLIDISHLFNSCSSLKFLPDISKWKVNNILNFDFLFSNCSSLEFLPNISNWNTKNIKSFKNMFNECEKIKSLPDLSKWKTDNVINMNALFNKCKNLKEFPDISKWNTSNVIDISSMFSECESLISLPDISKWNTKNVEFLNDIFYGCSAIEEMSDISKWNTLKAKDFSRMFYNCKKLKDLPNISRWNTSKVSSMIGMFYGCNSLKALPDLSKWETSNVTSMNAMFFGCYLLESLPDNLNRWNTSNLISMNSMFYKCYSLDYLPDITKWDISKVKDMIYIFYGCSPSLYIDDISKWNKDNIRDIINKNNKKQNIMIFEQECQILSYNSTEYSKELNKKQLEKKIKFSKYFIDNQHYVCKKCLKFPKINFASLPFINVICGCGSFTLSIKESLNKYNFYKEELELDDKNLNKIESFYICKEHIKKYKFYCKKCQKNLCKKCLMLQEQHSDEDLIIFDAIFIDLDTKIKSIKEKLNNKNIFDKEDIINKISKDDLKIIEKLFNIIIDEYNKYPNYNLIETIEKLYIFLFFKTETLKSIEEIKKTNAFENIISIIIKKENLQNLDIFCNLNLINLKNLILPNNNIVDISPLKNAKLANLEYLSLEFNKINDQNIPVLKELNFKKLNKLNLFGNNLTNLEFFKNLNSFENLSILYVGNNKFVNNFSENRENNANSNFNINNYNLSQIKEIGLTKGAFSDKFKLYLSEINFNNLEIIILNKNGLNSLSFTEQLECPNLFEIYLNDNYISEFIPLIKFKTLKIIELENNKIENIDNLDTLLGKLLFLEKINLKGNKRINKKKNNQSFINSLEKHIKIQL